jgi:hypothetical protein
MAAPSKSSHDPAGTLRAGMTTGSLTRLPWRVAGLTLLIACVLVYDPSSDSALQRLLVPLIMALGAWALIRNLTVVAMAVAVLAVLASAPGSGDWITSLAYPATAAAASFAVIWSAVRRFRLRIRETHAERWSDR